MDFVFAENTIIFQLGLYMAELDSVKFHIHYKMWRVNNSLYLPFYRDTPNQMFFNEEIVILAPLQQMNNLEQPLLDIMQRNWRSLRCELSACLNVLNLQSLEDLNKHPLGRCIDQTLGLINAHPENLQELLAQYLELVREVEAIPSYALISKLLKACAAVFLAMSWFFYGSLFLNVLPIVTSCVAFLMCACIYAALVCVFTNYDSKDAAFNIPAVGRSMRNIHTFFSDRALDQQQAQPAEPGLLPPAIAQAA